MLQAEIAELTAERMSLEERKRGASDVIAALKAEGLASVEAVAAQRAALEEEATTLRADIEQLSAAATFDARTSSKNLLQRLNSMGSGRLAPQPPPPPPLPRRQTSDY